MFLSQPTTAAPSPGPAAPAAPTQSSQGAPAAPAAPDPFGGGMIILLPLLMLAFTWFMTNRQNSKQKEIESSLKPGDVVVTQSGLIGKIIDLGEVNAKLEIAPGVNVKVRKSSIQGPEAGAPPADSAATKDKANEKKA